MRKSNFALRLQPSLLDEARKVAETEGVGAESVHQRGGGGKALRAPDRKLFRATRARGEHPAALAILKRAGTGKPPAKGDALPKRRR